MMVLSMPKTAWLRWREHLLRSMTLIRSQLRVTSKLKLSITESNLSLFPKNKKAHSSTSQRKKRRMMVR